MKKRYLALVPMFTMLAPFVASAHAHGSYLIGGVQYDIVIGSLNEPIVVDDKTGLDLRVTSGGKMKMSEDGDMEPTGGKPALGLEKDLKVEMIAGATKKTYDLSPAWGMPGAYKTTFYPTLATSFTYRLFGKIGETPVDLSFTCRPEGATAVDEGEKEISQGVKQLMKGGGFGCALEKEAMGFPEKSASTQGLASAADKAGTMGKAGIALALLAIGLTIGMNRRKH